MYMDQFEEITVGTSLIKPNIWLRCGDGEFIPWPQQDVEALLVYRDSKLFIQFTMVKKNEDFSGYTPTPKEEDKDGGI